jgi:hypothetical protein
MFCTRRCIYYWQYKQQSQSSPQRYTNKVGITGVRYRTTTSIRYALEEIRKRKVQQLERKRAVMIPGFFYLPLVTKSSGCHAGELLV